MLSYLDPGTGSMIIAAFAGGFAGFGVLIKMYGHRLLGVFSKKHRAQAEAAQAELVGEAADADAEVDAERRRQGLTPARSGTRCRGSTSTTTACGGACPKRPSPTTRRSPHPRSSATPSTRGDIVGTERVDDVAPAVPGEWAAVLRHDRIDVLSYPYEWPFEMLRDAALLQLALTRGALAEKLITKDASPYNVQFVGTKPVFIDVGSFERLRPASRGPAIASSASCS